MMNELVKQDVASTNAAETLVNERVNKVIQVLEKFGFYEIQTVEACPEPVQFGKEDGNQ